MMGNQAHVLPASEVRNLKRAIRTLRRLDGYTAARDYGPLVSKATQSYSVSVTAGACLI